MYNLNQENRAAQQVKCKDTFDSLLKEKHNEQGIHQKDRLVEHCGSGCWWCSRLRYFCYAGLCNCQDRTFHSANHNHLRFLHATGLLVQSGNVRHLHYRRRRLQHERYVASSAAYRIWRLVQCNMGLWIYRLCTFPYELFKQLMACASRTQTAQQCDFADALFLADDQGKPCGHIVPEHCNHPSGGCTGAVCSSWFCSCQRRELLQCGL